MTRSCEHHHYRLMNTNTALLIHSLAFIKFMHQTITRVDISPERLNGIPVATAVPESAPALAEIRPFLQIRPKFGSGHIMAGLPDFWHIYKKFRFDVTCCCETCLELYFVAFTVSIYNLHPSGKRPCERQRAMQYTGLPALRNTSLLLRNTHTKRAFASTCCYILINPCKLANSAPAGFI